MDDQVLYVSTKKYVYFNEFGELTAVANNINESGNYIEVEQDDVINIITGLEQLSQFCVMFDGVEKKYLLKNKIDDIEIKFSIKNNIFEIQENIKNADIVVKQNLKNNCWVISLDNKIKKSIKIKGQSYKNLLHFGITEKNDPHMLYHYFVINLEDLITQPSVTIPFRGYHERDIDNTSIYTIKKFQSYCRKIING